MSVVESVARVAGEWREKLRTVGEHWASTAAERAASYPCDDVLPDVDQWLYRAIDVDAPAPLVFRWLCQLRVAPYSYDWIDNWGRTSPRQLTPGLDDVQPGQRAMSIFEIVGVEPGRSITLHSKTTAFNQVVGTYQVTPITTDRSRLVVKLGIVYPNGIQGELMRALLPAGDLIMMSKQLRTLKSLAERDARTSVTEQAPRVL